MQAETTKYRLSVYITQEVIRETPVCRIEKEWLQIVDTRFVDEALWYLPIPANAAAETEWISLMDGEPEIEMRYELHNGILALTLSDSLLPEQSFMFSYESDWLAAGAEVDGEILFYDMDGDGQLELIVALSSREWTDGPTGPVASDIYWIAVWCVGYTKGEGFWQASGSMVTYLSHGSIHINRFGERELSESETFTSLRLEGRDLAGSHLE